MPRTSMFESLLTPTATSRPGASGSLPHPVPGTALAAGASHLVEASTTEAALAEVNGRLGPDARIVDARRVRRGGVAGFFTKEVVQLHARAGDTARSEARPRSEALPRPQARRAAVPTPAGATATATATAAAAAGGGSPVDRLLANLDAAPDDVDFATYLRDHLEPEGEHGGTRDERAFDASARPMVATRADPAADGGTVPAPDAASTPVADRPTTTPADRATERPPWLVSAELVAAVASTTPTRSGAEGATPDATADTTEAADVVGWSGDALVRLGLPLELVRSVQQARPTDDLSWTAALTEALRPSCRPLPAGPSVLVGPRADELGPADRFDHVEVARSQTWLAAVRPGRWVHLVVGGDGWRSALDEEPLAVSWTRPDALADAVRCAVELGLVLAHGPGPDAPRRAQPFDVALAIRDLVVGR